jgi:protein-L-isoaspartate O-methyltransferase
MQILPLKSQFVARITTIGLLVFPPILVLGLSFPLLIRNARDLELLPAREVGQLYFVNTIGAALGAIAATYALVRTVGTLHGFLGLTLLLAIGSVLALAWKSVNPWRPAGVLALVMAVAALVPPTSLVHLRPGEDLIESAEDEYGVQVLARTERGALRVRNNRLHLVYDLGYLQTSHAQQMAAHLSVLLAAECRDIINIGTGYGITAGTFTLYPDVRSIETVEILPFLVARQQRFAPYNFAYWNDPRVTLRQGDGRHVLVAAHKTYDIISVNVLDPYLPGSSSLYTTDFYRALRERLRPGGVMTQLLWGHDLMLLLRGLKTVFPDLLLFPAYGGTSYNAVAFRDPVDLGRLRFRLERLTAVARKEIRRISAADGQPDNPDVMLPALLERAVQMSAKLQAQVDPRGPLHTDDRPLLEYRWAHGMPNVSILDSPLVNQ